MERRMTVVQALEERDLLMKRITKYTRQGCYVDLIGPGPGVTQGQKLSDGPIPSPETLWTRQCIFLILSS